MLHFLARVECKVQSPSLNTGCIIKDILTQDPLRRGHIITKVLSQIKVSMSKFINKK